MDIESARLKLSAEMEVRFNKAKFHISPIKASRTYEAIEFARPGGVEIRGPIFLLNSDWASVCQNIPGYEEGEFKIPFDECVFEFDIGGIRLVSFFRYDDKEDSTICAIFADEGRGWFAYTLFYLRAGRWMKPAGMAQIGSNTLLDMIVAQVKATSVLIEADVLETVEIVPAPKLQRAKARRGKSPLNSFLTLRPRKRAEAHSTNREYQGVVRCHFRRGHWLHVGEKRIWRKWAIVGNPDLGFVDKTYLVGGR